MKLKMRDDNLLLKPIKLRRKSGISSPDDGYNFRFFEVVEMGPGAYYGGELTPLEDLRVGDTIGLQTDDRVDIEIDGRGYRIISAQSVTFVVEGFEPPEGFEIVEE